MQAIGHNAFQVNYFSAQILASYWTSGWQTTLNSHGYRLEGTNLHTAVHKFQSERCLRACVTMLARSNWQSSRYNLPTCT